MKSHRTITALFILALAAPSIGIASVTWTNAEFSYKIQPLLKRDPMTIPAGRQQRLNVGAIMFPPDWKTFQYVEKDVILKPASKTALANFMNKWKADLISDGAIPAPPQGLSSSQRKIPARNGWYRLRVNVDSADIDFPRLYSNAKEQGLTGLHVFSSWKMLALFALVLESRRLGYTKVTGNLVAYSEFCPITSTKEYSPWGPNPGYVNGGYYDAFEAHFLADPDIRVTEAWQVIDLFGLASRTVNLAVIDYSFVMNDDFPSHSDYDFVDEDYDANIDDSNYHGTKCISMAAARMDNRFGFAGTGAPVTHPVVFRVDHTIYQVEWAIRTAIDWGAEVVSISIGGTSQYRYSDVEALDETTDLAFDNNVVVLVAAGNDGVNIDDNDQVDWPAECGSGTKRPIVVGAINLLTKNAARTEDGSAWSSNFGSALKIWAPGEPEWEILTTPTPADDDVSHFNGTSCAAPYVAGVVAMMKALDPDIGTNKVKNILAETANTSIDGRVSPGYINALGAVLGASGTAAPASDEWEPNDFGHFTPLSDSGYVCANLSSADDEDGYMFYLDDFMHVELNTSAFFDFDGYDAKISGSEINVPRFLPVSGTLVPGGYYIRFSWKPGKKAFYRLNYNLKQRVEIVPDRYEANNDIAHCAVLYYPEYKIGDVWNIEDLNFHESDDQDYFVLSLPELPGRNYNEALTITAEPSERGTHHMGSLSLTVYDTNGVAMDFGYALTLDNLKGIVSHSREVRFSVNPMFRRNYYRLEIGYDQWIMGVELPSQVSIIEIPEWIKAENTMHTLFFPVAYADGLPIDFPFPSDPAIVSAFLKGDPTPTIPTERIILNWKQKADLGVNFTFKGASNELNFKLIDGKGVILAQGMVADLAKAERNNNVGTIRVRIAYPSLPTGIYGVDVTGTRFGVPFTAVFDSLKTTSVEERGGHKPDGKAALAFSLSQNYPNPFNPETTIRFDLKEKCRVVLKVYDIKGREVSEITDATFEPGGHSVRFDASGLTSGVYIVRMNAGAFTATRKMLVVD